VWCVVQDSAVALFEHECAAECPTRPPVVEIDWAQIVQIGLAPANVFTLRLRGGRQISLRAEDIESCVEWVSCLMRLVAWRSVRAIQKETAPEWEDVTVRRDSDSREA